MTKAEADAYREKQMRMSLLMKSYDEIFDSLKQIQELIFQQELDGKIPDQNLRSWRNALTYVLTPGPSILGRAD